jgi:hypothetical protein
MDLEFLGKFYLINFQKLTILRLYILMFGNFNKINKIILKI